MKIGAVLVTAAALAGIAASGDAADQERCYGVAKAGENEGVDAREAKGSSTVDYQGNAWITVPLGSCVRMALPVQSDGTPRRGAPEPLSRDKP